MSGMRNLHRLAGALERLRHEAATGTCHLHPDRPRPAVGYIEGWDLHPKGVCAACKAQGERLGYEVHPDPLAQTAPATDEDAATAAKGGDR